MVRASLLAAYEQGFGPLLAEAAQTDERVAAFLDGGDDRKDRAMLGVTMTAPQRPQEVDINAAHDATFAARRTG